MLLHQKVLHGLPLAKKSQVLVGHVPCGRGSPSSWAEGTFRLWVVWLVVRDPCSHVPSVHYVFFVENLPWWTAVHGRPILTSSEGEAWCSPWEKCVASSRGVCTASSHLGLGFGFLNLCPFLPWTTDLRAKHELDLLLIDPAES